MAGGAWGERKTRGKITNQTSYLASLAADLAPLRLLSWKWGWLWWAPELSRTLFLLLLSRKLGGRRMRAKVPGMVY